MRPAPDGNDSAKPVAMRWADQAVKAASNTSGTPATPAAPKSPGTVAALLQGSRWEFGAEKFLEGKDSVELRPVADAYTANTAKFYRWFLQVLAAEVEPLRVEHSALVVARNAVFTGGDVEAARAITEATTRQRSSTMPPDFPPQQ